MTSSTSTNRSTGTSWRVGSALPGSSAWTPSTSGSTTGISHASDDLEYTCGQLQFAPPGWTPSDFITLAVGCFLVLLLLTRVLSQF